MYPRPVYIPVLGMLLSLFPGLSVGQPDPRAIDQVRSKSIVDQHDLDVIDAFVASIVREILQAQDFSQISRIRVLLTSRKGMQAQYAQQFGQSCYRHIATGLQRANDLPQQRQFMVRLNLLILADGLQEAGLAGLGLPYLKDPDPVIQYWAVRLVTNKAVVDRIRQGSWPLAAQIINQLGDLIGSSNYKGLDLTWISVAEFASKIGPQQGKGLLARLADMRLRMYANGQAKGLVQVDTVILRQLAATIQAQPAIEPAKVRRFAQLYSYAIQSLARCLDRAEDGTKQSLINLVVEVEERCIAPAIQGYQTLLRKAIESGDIAGLMAAHDRLLGSRVGPGRLASLWPFDYDPGQSAGPRHWPLELPAG